MSDADPSQRVPAVLGALLVGFAVHNVEELPGLPDWMARRSRGRLDPELYGSPQLELAMGSLTAVVAGLLAPAWRRPTPARTTLALLAVGGLLGNGVTHVAQGAVYRCYNPGLATATAVLLPLGTAALVVQHRAGLVAPRTAATAALSGAVLSFPLIVAALTGARALTRWRFS